MASIPETLPLAPPTEETGAALGLREALLFLRAIAANVILFTILSQSE